MATTAPQHPSHDGPPYVEHPLDMAVRRRAEEDARRLVLAMQHEPGHVAPWQVSDEHLTEIVEAVTRSMWGSFTVAVGVWEDAELSEACGAAPSAPSGPSARQHRKVA